MKPTLGLMLAGVLVGCGAGTEVTATAAPGQPANPAPPSATAETEVDSLPLARGFFIAADTPCAQASNANLVLHRGDGMGGSQEYCEFDRIVRTGPATFTATQTCTAIQGGHTETSTVVYEIESETSFSGDNRTYDWKYSARHCPQSELPEPWRSNDISGLGD